MRYTVQEESRFSSTYRQLPQELPRPLVILSDSVANMKVIEMLLPSSKQQTWLSTRDMQRETGMKEDIGQKLVQVLKAPQSSESQESFLKAMELTKAYASSGSVTHFSAVTRLFYDLFEMFETGHDPRQK